MARKTVFTPQPLRDVDASISRNVDEIFRILNNLKDEIDWLKRSVSTITGDEGGYAKGVGTTNYVTKWSDGPNGILTDSLLYDSGSAIGLGTASPGNLFHLYTPANSGVRLQRHTTNASAWDWLPGHLAAGDLALRLIDGATNPVHWYSTNTGFIGINETNPQANIHIKGASWAYSAACGIAIQSIAGTPYDAAPGIQFMDKNWTSGDKSHAVGLATYAGAWTQESTLDDLIIRSEGSGGIGFAIYGALVNARLKMYMDSNGQLVIGAEQHAPGNLLHLYTADNKGLRLQRVTTNASAWDILPGNAAVGDLEFKSIGGANPVIATLTPSDATFTRQALKLAVSTDLILGGNNSYIRGIGVSNHALLTHAEQKWSFGGVLDSTTLDSGTLVNVVEALPGVGFHTTAGASAATTIGRISSWWDDADTNKKRLHNIDLGTTGGPGDFQGHYLFSCKGIGATSLTDSVWISPAGLGIGATPGSKLDIFQSGCPFAYKHVRLLDDGLAHGMTDYLATKAFGQVEVASEGYGGTLLTGATSTDDVSPLIFRGLKGAVCGGYNNPAVEIVGALKSGTGITDISSTDRLFRIKNNATTRFEIIGVGNTGIGGAVDLSYRCTVYGNHNITGNFYVDGVQVVTNRVVDARLANTPNSGDATTDGIIDALRDLVVAHGLGAAA